MLIHLECLSHTPLHGYHDPAPEIVAEVERQHALARSRVEAFEPELVVIFIPDHYNGFFYDLMPPFCISSGARSIGDFNSQAGELPVPRDLAMDLARSVMAAELDVAVSYRMEVDHGCAQPLALLTGGIDRYPVIPVFINSVAPPMASCRRTRLLGNAVGRHLSTLDKRVLLVGSGGLSHEPPVPEIINANSELEERLISGRNPTAEARAARQDRTIAAARELTAGTSAMRALNPAWDCALLSLFEENRLSEVDGFTDHWITEHGGKSAHEIRTWIAAFSALAAASPQGRYTASTHFYQAIPEWIAGYGMMAGKV